MTNQTAATNQQPRYPEIYVSEQTPKTFHALVRWHYLLHSSWGNPLGLSHWPTDDDYNGSMAHWFDLEEHPESDAWMLLDEEEPLLVGIRTLANLMLADVDAMREQVEVHGIPYHITTRRGKKAWDIELYPALKILSSTPPTQARALTRHRAAWALIAIKAGLWFEDTGYLRHPDDLEDYEQECDMRLYKCSHLPNGPMKSEAIRINKVKLATLAARRRKRQHQLFRAIYRLPTFGSVRSNSELWRGGQV